LGHVLSIYIIEEKKLEISKKKDRVILNFSNYNEKINMPYNIQHSKVSWGLSPPGVFGNFQEKRQGHPEFLKLQGKNQYAI
jgi:hypothetical protein